MNIKIELGDFFEDYRKETLLFIDIEEKRLVCDVIQYICEVCEIEERQESNETICLFANEIFIPDKQPSLVLKEVKDLLSLRRQKFFGKSNYRKNEGNKTDNKKFPYSVDEISFNNLDDSNNVIHFTEKALNKGITYSNLRKGKRKRDQKNILDNPELLVDHGKSNVSDTRPISKSHYVSGVNKSVEHIINEVSPKTLNLELSSQCNIHLDNIYDIPEYLNDQNATKSLSKKKKSRKKEKYSSEEFFESNGTISVINTSIDNICNSNNTENICSNKEKECLLTPSISPSTSSVDLHKYNGEHEKSQINIKKNEIVKGKSQKTEILNVSEDCNNSSIDLLNTQKRKRKRKHNKKSRIMTCKEFGPQSIPVIPNDYCKQKWKLLKKIDNSDKKNKHIKFGSDEEESKLENDSTSKICTPISAELQNVIFLASNICNQVSSKYTNNSICSNIVDSSSAIVEVHPVMPLTFHNRGKDPPSSSEHTKGCIDSITFANLLKLENSKEVSIFKRENLKPCLNSQNIESNNSFEREPVHIINSAVTRSPPSPKIFNTKSSKGVSSELKHYEELEKSAYPHVYYRKKKALLGIVDKKTVSLSREVAYKNVSNESFLELPSSFTSGNSKSERKNLPILITCFATEEVVKSSETNGINYSTGSDVDGISFTGAKPKKFKEKKIYSPLGMIINSLRNSKQNEIANEGNGTKAIDHLNTYHKELDTVIVDQLEPNFNELPEYKAFNEEKVMLRNDCANPVIHDSLVEKTETEASVLDCQSIVDLTLSSDIANIKEKNNLNYFYKSCPLIRNLPNEGDIIAAKVMTLDDTFSPCFSDYRPAKVISISSLNLSLLFLDQNEFTLDELQKDNVSSICKNGKISSIDWRDLEDVRLVFP